ncbi:MAG TPA: SapC family protein [Albitalea sp.]|nr:SapC family protein [Albitalea sp.]
MINSALYRQPELLDSKLHRDKKLQGLTDYSVAKGMHAVFLTATEFPPASLDLPIIFIHTGERLANGKAMVSPVALLGVTPNENLRVDDAGRWQGRYVPAFIRRFPFLTAGVQGSDAPAVFVDVSWPGFSDTEGEPLFDAEGRPTDALKRAIDFLQRFDEEQRRTRAFCERLVELDLLKEMEADAKLPSGEDLKVQGILAVDEDKLRGLPDKTVVELHRNGMLMLMQTQLISMNNMRELIERKALRMTPPAAAAGAASTATA